ncbi:MAG: hypothetical protein WEF50_10085 [Myxococcota bacterium]
MNLRRLGFVAVLLALVGILTAGLLELLVRLVDPQILPQDVPDLWLQDEAIGWKHTPNARVVANTGDRDVEICTDAEGDRVDCDAPPGDACAKRILVLGDSYVEALAVPYPETVWQHIDADTGACSSVSGVSGHRLSQYLASARQRLEAPGAHYDLVILAFYVGNDMTDDAETIPPAQDVQKRPLRLLPAGLSPEALYDWFYPLNAWLESRSHAYVAVRFAIRRFRDPGDAGLYGVSRALRRSQLTPRHLDETTRGVRLVAEAAHRHGARILVIVIPERTQVVDPKGEKILHAMPALAGDLDMDLTSREFVPRLEASPEIDRVVDLLPILRANTDPADWGAHDGHFSPIGHTRVFDAIREPVRDLLRLE